jgi:hypothetical protein
MAESHSGVDRRKRGLKRSLATEGYGIPPGIASAGANRPYISKVARKRAQTPPALLHRGWRFSMARPPGQSACDPALRLCPRCHYW